MTCNNLGKLLSDRGRADQAVPLLNRAVAGLEHRLRAGHPAVAAARRNLREAESRLT